MSLPQELHDSRDHTLQPNNGTGRRQWLVKWEDRFDFTGCPQPLVSLFSEGTEDEGLSKPTDLLICESLNFKGVGAGRTITIGGSPMELPFDCAIVTANYRERRSYSDNALETYRGSIRFLNVGGDSVWDDGHSTLCEFPVQKAFPQGTLIVPIFFLYNSGIRAALDALQGKLNNGSWLDIIGGGSYGTETVRFDSYDCDEVIDPILGRLSKITYHISINPQNWNMFPGPGGTMMRRIPNVYSTANLANLWTVGTRVV